ncbi:MAG TPA: prolyl oligopeptidase family serine peptidase, partial [Vicinamibacterales bacterium]
AIPAHPGATAVALVTDPKLNLGGFDWAPDAARIAFAATRDSQLADSGSSDIYLVSARPGAQPQAVVRLPGPDTNPHFSPDGRSLAFNSALGAPDFFYANRHIATLQLDTPGAAPVDATPSFDEDANLIAWGPHGILFTAERKTRAEVDLLTPAGTVQTLSGTATYRAIAPSFSHDFSRMAFLSSDPEHMAEVTVSSTDAFTPRRITDFARQLAGFTLGTTEVISWTSHDGATIEGILHKPKDFVAGRKYPLFVIIHGGPTGTSNAALDPVDTYYPVQRFLARGALVLEPNYRGSAGYGAAFRKLNVRNLGVGDMWDVMSGVDSLIARGLVDPSKMGAMGWSEGGYISAFLTTHTDRFQAISVGAGISDWMTYYVSTDITPFTRQYLLSTPWSDPAIYAKTSPISTITQAKTPTLIQQGSLDQRVPVPDSFELYRGLQDMHVPSRLILYTGYGHPITKPKSNLAVLQSNWDWFAHYIWGDPIPTNSPLLGTSELK